MNDHKHNNTEPWENDSYETGSTRPPKSYGGLVAVLLVLVILLCGVSSILGVMNIRLGIQMQGQNGVGFFSTEEADLPADQTLASAPPAGEDAYLQLSPAPEGVENIPQTGGLSLQQIYEKNIQSVVSVSCVFANGTGSGTGVILSQEGYIVTNFHVIDGAKTIRIRLWDDRSISAAVVGTDPVSDLAVLYIQAEELQNAEFGDSTALRVGDAVVAIGDPLGVELRGTMTDGIVSAINRDVTVNGRKMTLIQTNAALNSGNSGGPLINCYGQVIGINTMKISAFVDKAGVEGLGFAIPSTTVRDVVNQLIRQGYVSGRPDLGLKGQGVSPLEQRFYHLPAGYYVMEVTAGGAAEKAGIQEGDILISINGTAVPDETALNSVLYAMEAGDQAELVIYRNRNRYSVNVVLDEVG